MISDLVKSKQMSAAKKRDKSEGPLIAALLIGAFAAAGIIIAANNEPDEAVSSAAPTQQLDGVRH